MTLGGHTARIALGAASLLLMHLVILRDAYGLAVTLGLGYVILNLAMDWFAGRVPPYRSPWRIPVLVMIAAQFAVWLGFTSAVAVVLAPSVVVNLALLVLFGQTLLPEREPLITRFRRFEHGHVAPMFVAYTRKLTLLWTAMFGVSAVVSMIAALSGDVVVWSWLSFVVLPIVNLLLFFGEHVYRAIRYGAEGRASPLRTLRIILHPDAWLVGPSTSPKMREPAGD